MGNAESIQSAGGVDRPGPLVEEGRRLVGMGLHEAAVVKFKRAYELHKEGGSTCAAAAALRQAVETGLMMGTPDYELAATGFEEVGRLFAGSEVTKRLAATGFANSIFCLLAAGRGKSALQKLHEFDEYDMHFGDSLDGTCVRVILANYANRNRAQVLDSIEGLKECGALPTWRLSLLEKVVERL